jgi:hypothetical protein
MMQKTIHLKPIAAVIVIIAIITGLNGCASPPTKPAMKTKAKSGETLKFTRNSALQEDFSSRTQQPSRSSAHGDELLKAGYVEIGHLYVKHTKKECYERENCVTIYQGKDQPTTALLKAAAYHGADLVVIKKNNVPTKKMSFKRGKCLEEGLKQTPMKVPIVDYRGRVIGLEDGPTVSSKYCIKFEQIPGKAYITESFASLWRREPEFAGAQLALAHAKPVDQGLLTAASKGELTNTKMLLSQGANPNFTDRNRTTPLHEAAKQGHTTVAKLLIAKGAKVNSKDKWGRTPLHRASFHGHAAVAEFLITAGADVNAKDKNGDTPLHEVASAQLPHVGRMKAIERFTVLAELLMANGANTNAKNNIGRTPRGEAVINDKRELDELLKRYGGKK